MADLVEFLGPERVTTPTGRIGGIAVEGSAIDADHRGDIILALHPPFDLQAVDAGGDQGRSYNFV